ncbi:alpha/beta hydrolase family protein [Mumia flava]|uniref:Alpha/beta hydrolase family protein n=1 Tax=Mumia flava TaxID=1348852 RepID=A0A2M9B609_9ACTN|nr:alpha/beta hydrolase [Mumia flava]PJJ53380.1 alpha/beta hydrolase family protein [Mumia flava]
MTATAPVLLLHALGETGDDWATVSAAIGPDRPVLAPDLRGHGAAPWEPPYTLDRMRDDVAALLDERRAGPVDVIGHSMGGVVAYLLAAERPDLVRRLVLEDVGAPYARTPSTPERPPGDLAFSWEMVLAVREQIDAPPPHWLDALGRITAPTLVIGGGQDSHVPQDWVRDLAERVPDATLRTLATGHLVHATDPDGFLALVRPFLGAGR